MSGREFYKRNRTQVLSRKLAKNIEFSAPHMLVFTGNDGCRVCYVLARCVVTLA
jgi:hypothetical protein